MGGNRWHLKGLSSLELSQNPKRKQYAIEGKD
jgi:hypothetical protein